MKLKYMTIFLMGLLCLVGNKELFSQHCLKMSYDRNGNRISFRIDDCEKDWREKHDDVDEEEILVYPNPTNGKFRVELKNDKDTISELSLYDNKGILINSSKFIGEIDVDISNDPAGVYLLRILNDDGARSMVVIKI